jgi:hypothetical protein
MFNKTRQAQFSAAGLQEKHKAPRFTDEPIRKYLAAIKTKQGQIVFA